MKERPDKPCGKGAGLTWSRRTIGEGVVTWRLFRRDAGNAVHAFVLELGITTDTCVAARLLKLRKRQLREQVRAANERRAA